MYELPVCAEAFRAPLRLTLSFLPGNSPDALLFVAFLKQRCAESARIRGS
jgi:hypothetical protein